VLGIDSDRLYPVEEQRRIAAHLPGNIDGDVPHIISSPFGHDGFLIEDRVVGDQLRRLLES
jgi:homoserine O-acetyltransferase